MSRKTKYKVAGTEGMRWGLEDNDYSEDNFRRIY